MFGRQIRLFRMHGFEIKADMTWFVLVVIVTVSLAAGTFPRYYPELSTLSYVGMGLIGAAGLFFSIILHEFCHALVGSRYGMPIKEITLFLFGGVAHLEDEPPGPASEFAMSIVGPLLSAALGLFFYGVARFGEAQAWSRFALGILIYLSQINLILAVFNMIPAFPLDGGRVLRAILWAIKKDIRWATRIASAGGTIFGYFLVFSGFVQLLSGQLAGGFWSVLLGLLLVGIAKASYQQLLMKQSLTGQSISMLMNTKPVTVDSATSIEELLRRFMYDSDMGAMPVVDGGRLVGCVQIGKINAIPMKEWRQKTAGDLRDPCSGAMITKPEIDAEAALQQMIKTGQRQLFVVENEQLLGVITLTALSRYLAVRLQRGVPAEPAPAARSAV